MTKQLRPMTIHVYADPGHAWGKVPAARIVGLGIADDISSYSYMIGEHAYLEEDCDLPRFVVAARSAGYDVTFCEHHCNGDSAIRRYPHYSAASCRSRAVRPVAAPGVIAIYAGKAYVLQQPLGRRGWDVLRNGCTYRMNSRQLSEAILTR